MLFVWGVFSSEKTNLLRYYAPEMQYLADVSVKAGFYAFVCVSLCPRFLK